MLAVVGLALVGTTLHAGVAHAIPVADFDWGPKAPISHQTLTFTSTSTVPAPDTIVKYEWDFDDDDLFDEATGPEASWTFTRPGPHVVALRVTDSVGTPDEKHHRVVIGNRTPVPSAISLPASPGAGQPVTLLSNSYDPDGYIASFAWDLDSDGAYDDGGGSSISTSFPAGRHAVGLRVTDDSGDTAATTVFVEVSGAVSVSGQSLLSPFPVVRVSGIVRKKGIRLRLLTVTGPVGATVHVRCGGRGCPFKRTSKVVQGAARTSATAAAGLVQVKRFRKKLLRDGAIVRIFVTREGAIGKYTRLRIRKSRPPARVDRCVTSVNEKPFACP